MRLSLVALISGIGCFQLLGCAAHSASSPPWSSAVTALDFVPLKAPTSALGPGWVIRERDQEPFFSACFVGSVQKGNSFDSYAQTNKASSAAEAKVRLGKYAEAVGDFSRISALEVQYSGLRTDSIIDLKPNMQRRECFARSLSKMVAVKSLLSFQTIKITVQAATGASAKAVASAIAAKVGAIDAQASASLESDDKVAITGSSLYVGYRALLNEWLYSETSATVSGSQVGYLGTGSVGSPRGDYEVSLAGIRDGKAALRLRGIGVGASADPLSLTLGVNEAHILYSGTLSGAVVVLRGLNGTQVEVAMLQWSIAIGALPEGQTTKRHEG